MPMVIKNNLSSLCLLTAIVALFTAGCDNKDPQRVDNSIGPPEVVEETEITDELQALNNGQVITQLSSQPNKRFIFEVILPDNSSEFSVTTHSGMGDASLYVKQGAYPSHDDYDCLSNRGRNNLNDENCLVEKPTAGSYYIIVAGEYQELTLSVSWQVENRILGLNGDFIISSIHADTLLGVVREKGANDNNIVQYTRAEVISLNNVIWTFEPYDEHYVIRQSGTALTVANSSVEQGANITRSQLDYRDAQLFEVVQTSLSNEAKTIISKASSQALTVKNASHDNGANIEQQIYNGQENLHQQWLIIQHVPVLTERELVTAEDAWDVFEEAGEPYVGPNYQQNFSVNNIYSASPIDPRLVTAGTMIPGRVIDDGAPLVEYYPGTLPFIAVCIHNSTRATQQMRENYPKGWRECNDDGTHSCDPIQAAINFRDGKNNPVKGDAGSGELCSDTVNYLEKVTGQRPHMIIPHWPKGLLDMNRSPRNKVAHVLSPLRQHPDLLATWDDFMGFVREARDIAYQEWGGGLQIGFHGQTSRFSRNHFGTNILASVLDVPESVLNDPSSNQYQKIMRSSSLKYSLNQRNLEPWEAYKGNYSLGQGVASRGITTFPSATMKDQNGPFWSTGGDFERTSISSYFQDKKIQGRPYPDHHKNYFDSVQLESYTFFINNERV
ncbi:MAG: RICIN domain-containing protein, partial [Kangiellaceae bacterium]|nr:RICIN domain-containing protein [Kangiellaceae bacterium]